MKLLLEHHDNLWKQSRRKLKEYLVYKEQENLHDFRKTVKELIVIFNLFYFLDKNFDSEQNLRRINKMYEHAGELRDEFITQLLAKKYGIILQTQEDLSVNHFEKLKKYYVNNAGHNSTAKQKARILLSTITPKDITAFFHFSFSKLKTGIVNTENLHDIHQVRKDIKEYILLNKIIELEGMGIAKTVDLDSLDQLQNLIGTKHDIEKFLRKISAQKFSEKTGAVVTKIEKDEKKITQEISLAFRTWIKKSEHES